MTRQGTSSHGLKVEARVDSRRKPYYWLAYARAETAPEAGTDAHAVTNGRIAVTPLRLDMTLRGWPDPARRPIWRLIPVEAALTVARQQSSRPATDAA